MRILGMCTLLVVGSATVLAVGCGKKKDDSGVPVTQYEAKIGTACSQGGVDDKDTSPKDSCETIKKDIEAGCNVEARKRLQKALSCDGTKKEDDKKADENASTSTTTTTLATSSEGSTKDDSSTDKSAVTTTSTTVTTTTLKSSDVKSIENPDIFKTVIMISDKVVDLEIKATADKTDTGKEVVSQKVQIGCADNLKKADEMKSDVTLVGTGKLAVVKAQNTADSKDSAAALAVSCIKTDKEKDDFSKESVTKLKVGNSVSDKELKVEILDGKNELLVSCTDSAMNSFFEGKNGIQLLEGTTMLLRNSTKSALVSCEK